ncbi:uncharacterized protein RAG0_04412 [Rhynchosporium agropyri]|uniref:Uncharacterized protein n=1 Tax=Rhynchosporium agropyri TaxID=914238 RepID=A0A1E1K8L2_9HELO|nr:uncharacterized protein RAG0_04412 [Rhynchosporium agropyri]
MTRDLSRIRIALTKVLVLSSNYIVSWELPCFEDILPNNEVSIVM